MLLTKKGTLGLDTFYPITKKENILGLEDNEEGHSGIIVLKEDNFGVMKEETMGTPPFSTSYKYTRLSYMGIRGVSNYYDGMVIAIIVDDATVVQSDYRNVTVNINELGDVPLYGDSSILAGSSYLVKNQTRLFMYKSTYLSTGAFHLLSDNNASYSYISNSIVGNTFVVDSNGYAAYSGMAFFTSKFEEATSTISSLVSSRATAPTKEYVTPSGGKFYIDRPPIYLTKASYSKESTIGYTSYSDYAGQDLRYTSNLSSTYVKAYDRVYVWLKNFSETDFSFENVKGTKQIVSHKALSSAFPSSNYTSPIYLYFLGWTTGTWYSYQLKTIVGSPIYEYNPSDGSMKKVKI